MCYVYVLYFLIHGYKQLYPQQPLPGFTQQSQSRELKKDSINSKTYKQHYLQN